MSEKSELFKKEWACEIHPSCIYCIPCDCNNCKMFEISLRSTVSREKARVGCLKDRCVSPEVE